MDVKYAVVMSPQFHQKMPRILARICVGAAMRTDYVAVVALFLDVVAVLEPERDAAVCAVRNTLADPTATKQQREIVRTFVLTQWLELSLPRSAMAQMMEFYLANTTSSAVVYTALHGPCGTHPQLRSSVEAAGGEIMQFDDDAHEIHVCVRDYDALMLAASDGDLADLPAPSATQFWQMFRRIWTAVWRNASPQYYTPPLQAVEALLRIYLVEV